MVRAFPAATRFSGVSFSYNVAYAVFGGLTPVFVSLLLPWAPRTHVYYLVALCILGSATGLGLWRNRHRWLLRARRERPRRRAADQRDEVAPPHRLPSSGRGALTHYHTVA